MPLLKWSQDVLLNQAPEAESFKDAYNSSRFSALHGNYLVHHFITNMSQFTITSIDRASDIDRTYQTLITGFGDDRVTLTNEVFNSNDDIPQEATEGQFPVAFLLDYSYVPLFVTGRFRFPRQSAYYQLEVNGPGMFKMTSGRFAVTGNVDGTSKEFTTTFFSIESPKVGLTSMLHVVSS